MAAIMMAPAREQRRRFATQCLGRPGRRLFGRGPFVNFRAGTNSGCLEINQCREIGQGTLTDAAIPGKKGNWSVATQLTGLPPNPWRHSGGGMALASLGRAGTDGNSSIGEPQGQVF